MLMRALPVAAFVLFLAVAPFGMGDGALHLATEIFVVVVISSMWNLLAGYAGLISLGHQMYFGAGGYVLFLFANATGLHPYWGLPVAFAFGGVAAALVAPLLFRLRDAYFAIASWVLAEIVSIAVQKTDALGGITGVSLNDASVIDVDRFEGEMFVIGGVMALAAVLGGLWLLRSKTGLAFMCARDNERASQAIGVDVWPSRFFAYVLSAAAVAAAGALSLLGGLVVQPGNAFSPDWTVVMTFVVIVGGIGTLEGPILGAAIYFFLRQLLTVTLPLSGAWYLVAMGAVAVATMLFAPRGLWPLIRDRAGADWLTVRRTI
ncbi:MAG: branched-chain amino acid ABC transporter permease [Pseudomonadota bacterium]|nr:branched-chain amino acid ABC transporter permease [Pseudomonadota bacterium]